RCRFRSSSAPPCFEFLNGASNRFIQCVAHLTQDLTAGFIDRRTDEWMRLAVGCSKLDEMRVSPRITPLFLSGLSGDCRATLRPDHRVWSRAVNHGLDSDCAFESA